MKKIFISLAILITLQSLSFSPPKPSANIKPGPYYGQYHTIPLSDISPDGWLKELLLRQRDGLGLHHAESGYPYNTCLWAGQIPKGGNLSGQSWWPYEQTGYLVDGLYRCGLALKDTALISIGRRNIDFVLANPRANGQLGVDAIAGTQWPFSVFVRSMMADYDATQNPQILDALTKHFLALHKDNWNDREVCVIESMCWTYGQTGDERLISQAEHIWSSFITNQSKSSVVFHADRMIAADSVYGHGVSVSEIGKQPAILYLYTGKKEYAQAATGFFNAVTRDHGLVDGIPSSSESLAGKKPEGQHETCDISDYTWSIGYLMMATGDSKWGDQIERGIFNAGLGAISKDFKSHEYFSSPNQVFATQTSSPAGRQRKGWWPRQAYRPGFDTECCSGNVHRMFPNYVSRLWLKDSEEGLVAALYGPNTLTTKVGKQQVSLTVTEKTDYPFYGKIVFKLKLSKPSQFPFSLRIPAWAKDATVKVNGVTTKAAVIAGSFFTLNQTFKTGDIITLDMPMQVNEETPVAGGVSLTRGPLLFSLNIKEDKIAITDQFKTSAAFPAWDLKPASPWNYSLVLSDKFTQADIKVITHPVKGFPWLPENAPIRIIVSGRQIPEWQSSEMTPALPKPNFQVQKKENIELVPDGATRIRLSIFPVVHF
jgi:hypothetical protein